MAAVSHWTRHAAAARCNGCTLLSGCKLLCTSSVTRHADNLLGQRTKTRSADVPTCSNASTAWKCRCLDLGQDCQAKHNSGNLEADGTLLQAESSPAQHPNSETRCHKPNLSVPQWWMWRCAATPLSFFKTLRCGLPGRCGGAARSCESLTEAQSFL